MCVCRFQASAVTDRAGDLQNDTENTHQRAEDLLSFINNVTMDIESETQDGNIIHTHTQHSFTSLKSHLYSQKLINLLIIFLIN